MDFVAKIASSLYGACPRDLLHGLVPSCVSTLSQRLSRNSPYFLEEFRNLEDHGRLQALCCHFTMRNGLSFDFLKSPFSSESSGAEKLRRSFPTTTSLVEEHKKTTWGKSI